MRTSTIRPSLWSVRWLIRLEFLHQRLQGGLVHSDKNRDLQEKKPVLCKPTVLKLVLCKPTVLKPGARLFYDEGGKVFPANGKSSSNRWSRMESFVAEAASLLFLNKATRGNKGQQWIRRATRGKSESNRKSRQFLLQQGATAFIKENEVFHSEQKIQQSLIKQRYGGTWVHSST